MNGEEKLTPSLIDYLLCIQQLSGKQNHVKAIDIANSTGYTRASVFRAVKLLEQYRLIEVGEHHHILFTTKGRKIAQTVYARCERFRLWLESSGVPAGQAERDARKLGEAISEESYKHLQTTIFPLKSD